MDICLTSIHTEDVHALLSHGQQASRVQFGATYVLTFRLTAAYNNQHGDEVGAKPQNLEGPLGQARASDRPPPQPTHRIMRNDSISRQTTLVGNKMSRIAGPFSTHQNTATTNRVKVRSVTS